MANGILYRRPRAVRPLSAGCELSRLNFSHAFAFSYTLEVWSVLTFHTFELGPRLYIASGFGFSFCLARLRWAKRCGALSV